LLDVGGGRGRHARVWAELRHHAVVLDPGAAMIADAAGLPGVSAVRGVAQCMPFRDRCFDVAYFHLSIHYGDWRRALDEACRILRPGGRIVIWTLGPDHHAASMLGRWFPSVATIDRRRFPDPGDLAAHLLGRTTVSVVQRRETVTRRAGDWAAAVEAGFVSTLQLIPSEELGSGLAAFRERHPDPADLVSYEMYWTRLVARV
jgi:SAM-dependent methyltransferase